jgi:hypothetical protein
MVARSPFEIYVFLVELAEVAAQLQVECRSAPLAAELS